MEISAPVPKGDGLAAVVALGRQQGGLGGVLDVEKLAGRAAGAPGNAARATNDTPPPPAAPGLGRRDHSSHPFIEMLLDELEPPPDRPRVHHPCANIQSPIPLSGTFIL